MTIVPSLPCIATYLRLAASRPPAGRVAASDDTLPEGGGGGRVDDNGALVWAQSQGKTNDRCHPSRLMMPTLRILRSRPSIPHCRATRSEERRVGKEWRSRSA